MKEIKMLLLIMSHQADDVNHVKYAVAIGTANTYAVPLNPAPASYVEGMALSVKINKGAIGASTLNVNALGVKGIKKANGIYTLRYDGTNFILQGEGGSGNATASDLLSGKTASTDADDIVGTMPDRGIFNLGLGVSVPAGYYSGGSVPSGKRYASGQVVSYANGSMGNINVTGLSFRPSLIIANRYGYSNTQMSIYSVANPFISKRLFNVNQPQILSTIIITDTGFTIEVEVSGVVYDWYVYE